MRLDHVYTRITRGRLHQLIQRRVTLPGSDQLTHLCITAIEVARQALAFGVIDDGEQHRRILLGDSGKCSERRNIQIPDGLWRHPGQQLRQRLAGLLEIALEHHTQLRLLTLQLARKPFAQASAGTARQRRKALAHLALSHVQLFAKTAALTTQALRQILDHSVDRGTHQPNSQTDLHQHGQAKRDEHRAQQTATQHGNDGEHWGHSSTTVIAITATSGIY